MSSAIRGGGGWLLLARGKLPKATGGGEAAMGPRVSFFFFSQAGLGLGSNFTLLTTSLRGSREGRPSGSMSAMGIFRQQQHRFRFANQPSL